MRITSKGQVTIPQAVRESAGLLPNTEVDIVLEDGQVTIRKARPTHPTSRGRRAVQTLRGRAVGVGMSIDEIMALTRGEP
jgi:AbrB family looped-hinge helix DNA binding protein